MKKVLLGSLVLLMFSASIVLFNISCNKESDAQPQSQSNCVGPQPTLRFKGNGVLYECKGINDSRVGWAGYPFWSKENSFQTYDLSFSNYDDDYNVFANFPNTANKVGGFVTIKSLSIGTYTNSDNVFVFPDLNYRWELNPGSLVFIITSKNNGYASGTFSGKFPAGNSANATGPEMNITEGVFTNIPVYE
ncbi:MAG: hypothetical protein ACK5BV_05205 [Bacteroidota bacterium]|jgi:hypothetical protein